MKMCKINYFSLFCKSYKLVLFLTFIIAFRFHAAAPPQIYPKYLWSCICESLVQLQAPSSSQMHSIKLLLQNIFGFWMQSHSQHWKI